MNDDIFFTYALLTAAEFNVARLIVHRILVELHVTRQCQRQSLTIQNSAVRWQTNHSVRNRDLVKDAILQVTNKQIRSPESFELIVIQSDTVCKQLRNTKF